MKISIALCTYNGAKYLSEQLDSIAAQTLQPDELIVCDDRSTDDTVNIVREFSGRAGFPVVLFQNELNLGSTRNFEKAIEKCNGDIIALSDQDDVWLPQKLERIAAEFGSDPTVGLVFSDAILTDEHLQPIGINLWMETFRPIDQKKFAAGRALDVLLQYNVVTGATMAFRSSLRQAILPIPELTEFIHDGWISLVATLCSRIRFIREPLIKYRQHAGQQLGAGLWRWRVTRAERYAQSLVDRPKALIRLEEFADLFSGERLDMINGAALDRAVVPEQKELAEQIESASVLVVEHIEHIKARASLPPERSRRLPFVLQEHRTGRYRTFSRGWQSVILDLVRK